VAFHADAPLEPLLLWVVFEAHRLFRLKGLLGPVTRVKKKKKVYGYDLEVAFHADAPLEPLFVSFCERHFCEPTRVCVII